MLIKLYITDLSVFYIKKGKKHPVNNFFKIDFSLIENNRQNDR